jgi:NAD(P)-dependent dehydrogenase (short-subunit alcohol dehydrogenase family)
MSASTSIPSIVLISGANGGIGLATARIIASNYSDYHVIIGSRIASNGASAAEQLVSEGLSVSSIQLNITDDASIAAAVYTIESTYGRLDVLINNAGVMLDAIDADFTNGKSLSTRELFKQTFDVNVTGTACLTEALLPLLKRSSLPRVVFVSSGGGSVTLASDATAIFHKVDYKAYQASKAAVNMLAARYSMLLEGVSGKVNAVCPGLVNTKLVRNNPAGTTADVGAARIVTMATLGKEGATATFSNRDGALPW